MKGPPPSTPISVSFPPFPGSYLSPPLATLRSAPTTRHWPVCLSPFHAEQARWRSMSGWLTAGLILGPPRGPLRERGLGDEARQATTLRQDPPARTRSLLSLSPAHPLSSSFSISLSLSLPLALVRFENRESPRTVLFRCEDGGDHARRLCTHGLYLFRERETLRECDSPSAPRARAQSMTESAESERRDGGPRRDVARYIRPANTYTSTPTPSLSSLQVRRHCHCRPSPFPREICHQALPARYDSVLSKSSFLIICTSTKIIIIVTNKSVGAAIRNFPILRGEVSFIAPRAFRLVIALITRTSSRELLLLLYFHYTITFLHLHLLPDDENHEQGRRGCGDLAVSSRLICLACLTLAPD